MEVFAEAQNLSFRQHKQLRLDGLSLQLRVGEVTLLFGTNGAGKSTALALLAGAMCASSGTITFAMQSDLRIGYMPQQAPCYPNRTVDENLRFAASLLGIASEQKAQAVLQIKQQLDLLDWASHLAYQLSEGTRRRLGLAMAMVHQPNLLLLDEPTAGLDPLQAQGLRELLVDYKQQCAIVLSSHLEADFNVLADSVALLHQGQMLGQQMTKQDISYADLLSGLQQAEVVNSL